MLVLAMEFSRGAQRAFRAATPSNRPVPGCRMDGRAAGTYTKDGPASRRRVGIARAARSSRVRGSLPQNGIVMPIANLRAHGLTNGTPEDVRSARGGVGMTANSQ